MTVVLLLLVLGLCMRVGFALGSRSLGLHQHEGRSAPATGHQHSRANDDQQQRRLLLAGAFALDVLRGFALDHSRNSVSTFLFAKVKFEHADRPQPYSRAKWGLFG